LQHNVDDGNSGERTFAAAGFGVALGLVALAFGFGLGFGLGVDLAFPSSLDAADASSRRVTGLPKVK